MAFIPMLPNLRTYNPESYDVASSLGDKLSESFGGLSDLASSAKSAFKSFLDPFGDYDRLKDSLSNAKNKLGVGPRSPVPLSPHDTPAAKQLDYLNADLAKHYGMNATTAYNEAMANTAYQRAVKDMQAAGLNPALLAQSSYAQPAQSPSARGTYMSSGPSGGYSSRKSSDYSGVWQGVSSIIAGAVALKASGNPWAASEVAKVVGQSAKAIAKGLGK